MKAYKVVPDSGLNIYAALMYDKRNTDLDLTLIWAPSDGSEPLVWAIGGSNIKQFDHFECTVPPEGTFKLIVASYAGGSAYRLFVGPQNGQDSGPAIQEDPEFTDSAQELKTRELLQPYLRAMHK